MALACNQWMNTKINEPVLNTFEQEIYHDFIADLTSTKEVSMTVVLKEKLNNVYSQRDYDNWDGEDAYKLSYAAYLQAYTFIDSIKNLPQPQIIPYPNGHIGFDWKIKKLRLDASIVFDGKGSFMYVILAPDGESYGTELHNTKTQEKFIKYMDMLVNGI